VPEVAGVSRPHRCGCTGGALFCAAGRAKLQLCWLRGEQRSGFAPYSADVSPAAWPYLVYLYRWLSILARGHRRHGRSAALSRRLAVTGRQSVTRTSRRLGSGHATRYPAPLRGPGKEEEGEIAVVPGLRPGLLTDAPAGLTKGKRQRNARSPRVAPWVTNRRPPHGLGRRKDRTWVAYRRLKPPATYARPAGREAVALRREP